MVKVSFSTHERSIVSSGSVVLPSGKTEIAMSIDDIVFQMRFMPSSDTEPRTDIRLVDQKKLVIDLFGFNNSLGVSYSMPAVLTLNGKAHNVALMIHTVGENNAARLISYSIYED